MNRQKLRWTVAIVGMLFVFGVAGFIYSTGPGRSPAARFRNRKVLAVWRDFKAAHFPPLEDYRLSAVGTTGTPVIVGYRIDGGRSFVFQGVVPTNWTVKARRRVDVAVKNMGNSFAKLGYGVDPVSPGATASGEGFGGGNYPQYYGFGSTWVFAPTGPHSTGLLTIKPNDWPVTLPPGMTPAEAQKHDFNKELLELQLQDRQMLLANEPKNQIALVGEGQLNFRLNKRAAGEAAFQKFFATDCRDALFLNNAVWDYVEFGGTNLERAYELALKAQSLSPADPNIADTMGWVLFKRGYYQDALNTLLRFSGRADVSFHIGMTYYMLGQDGFARTYLQNAAKGYLSAGDRNELQKRLTILDLGQPPPRQENAAALKARLAEAPDDPVALSLLAQLYESGGNSGGGPQPGDPMLLKALGVQAFQIGEDARACALLAQSSKARTNDAQVLFYLGLAQNHLNKTNECAESLRKAVSLGLNAAQRERVKMVLTSFTPGQTSGN